MAVIRGGGEKGFGLIGLILTCAILCVLAYVSLQSMLGAKATDQAIDEVTSQPMGVTARPSFSPGPERQ